MKKAIYNNISILKMICQADRRRIILTAVSFLWNAFVDLVFGSLLIRFLIDSYEIGRSYRTVVAVLMILCAAQIGYSFYSNYYKNIYVPISDEKIYRYLQNKIFIRSMAVPLSDLDEPQYYDSFVKAGNETKQRAIACLDNISAMLAGIISLVILSSVMFRINGVFILIAWVSAAVAIIFGKRLSRLTYAGDMAVIIPSRKLEYLNRVFFLKNYAKEIKISKIHEVLFKELKDSIQAIRNSRKSYGKHIFLNCAVINVSGEIIGYFGAVLYALFLYSASALKLGDFAFVVTSLNRYVQAVKVFTDQIIAFYSNGNYLDNLLFWVTDVAQYEPEREQKRDKINFESMEFAAVSFAYTAKDKPDLDQISLQIKRGQRIVIVGDNGAGKSTFIKLLVNLYEPDSGGILLNGLPASEYAKEQYQALYSCVFQDFAIFACTIAENILGRKATKQDDQIIAKALAASGLDEDMKRYGWTPYSVLTKEFDDKGIVLSGGQLQKLAIARAVAKEAPIIVMDEPTSALDPMAEQALFAKLKYLYKDKTLIYITHRISSAITADMIYYFDKGRVSERGTHEELMKQNQQYANIYRMQARQYVTE